MRDSCSEDKSDISLEFEAPCTSGALRFLGERGKQDL